MRRQTQLREERLCFVNRFAPPIRLAAVWPIPGLRQAPALVQAQQRALGQVPLLAPTIHVFFRPEEKHGLSVEHDILPPAACRERKVDDAGIALYLTIHHR